MATIRDAGITGDFVHEPLKDTANEIRLINIIHSEDGNDVFHCTVSTFPIGCCPPYVAISYTWGDSIERRTILMNDKWLSIGYNSWHVLSQMKSSRTPEPLWMDVLSIDQKNDKEKSIQVGNMGKIYKSAQRVYICVGQHEGDSAFLAEQIKLHAQWIRGRRKQYHDDTDEPYGLPKCSACGQLPLESIRECEQCEGLTLCEGCDADASVHESTGHTFIEETLDPSDQDACAGCYRWLYRSWYACKACDRVRFCAKCAVEAERGAHSEHGLVLSDQWGPVNQVC